MTDTYTPVLTDSEITRQKYALGVIAPDEFFNKAARAIECAAIEAYQRQQWRDPDTAPKDSSFVLVSASGEVWMGAFHNGGWIISNPRSTMGDVDIDGWQPLPPPPETI